MKKRALLIGLNNYHLLAELKYARQDAEAFADALRNYCGFTDHEITLMTCRSEKALLGFSLNIELALRHLIDCRDLDLLVFGFWGHGFSPVPGRRYLCGIDTNEDELERSAVSLDVVKGKLTQVQAENTLLILDCCQNRTSSRGTAEPMTKGEESALAGMARDIRASRRKKSSTSIPTIAILNSCREGQKAYEWDSRSHGIFTAYLLDAFEQGYYGIAQIASWTSERVAKTALEIYSQKQIPYIMIEGKGDIRLIEDLRSGEEDRRREAQRKREEEENKRAEEVCRKEEAARVARQMVELLRLADHETLVIALISGGGSSMMALPAEGLTLEDYRSMCQLILTVPTAIDEMNAVRKHIDPLKGGGMRKYAKNAGGFITLSISDVPATETGAADDPSIISSGPTVGDDSTFETAIKVLAKYGIWEQTPAAIKRYLQDHSGQNANETLRKDAPLLIDGKGQYVIIADNDRAMEASAEKAIELGYDVHLMADKIKAEVNIEVDKIWKVIKPFLTPLDRVTFASFSTDGVDGHSNLAGAIADNDTLKTAERRGLDYKKYRENFDSASFFKQLDLGIEIGPSGTNVADISLILICNEERKLAFIFGGEATVKMTLIEDRKPGFGGRNTHLALLAAERLNLLSYEN